MKKIRIEKYKERYTERNQEPQIPNNTKLKGKKETDVEKNESWKTK